MGTQCINSTNTGPERKASQSIKLYRFFDTSKGKDFPVHTIKAYRRRRIALNLDARWGVSGQFHAPAASPRGKEPWYPLNR